MDVALRRRGISLADVGDFSFGALAISPSTRQVVHRGTSITLEPRVMRVLVALAEADGRVVSRDMLLDRCWDGTIVGDNAINRVIARLRRLADETGAFTIETVARVGYRISPNEIDLADPPPPAAMPTPPAAVPGGSAITIDRRWLLAGGAASFAAGGAALLLLPHDAAPGTAQPAAMLVEKARVLMEVNERDVARQAIRMFEEAVALDPGSAVARGALALALANHAAWAWEEEAGAASARAQTVARQALAIDPDNADAALALIVRRSWFGRWKEYEQALRAVIARHPGLAAARSELAFLLCQAGRWADALVLIETLARQATLTPRLFELHGTALAALDRRLEADRMLAEGLAKWPSRSMMWSARFEHLLSVGRLAEAREMVTERAKSEFRFPTIPMDLGLEVTAALAAEAGDKARAKAAEQVLAAREKGAIWSASAARLLVLLARPGAALQVTRAYLVGGRSPAGRMVPPPPPFALRRTEFLFLPFMAPLRALDGFSELMGAIGLAAYWQQTGTTPQIAL